MPISEPDNISVPAGSPIGTDQNLFGKSGKVRGVVLDRDETSVPIHLSELGAISTATAKAAFWWSVATFAGGCSLALYLAGLAISQPDAGQIALTRHDPIVCAALAAICAIAAIRETVQRTSLVHQIERECGLQKPTLPQRVNRWLRSWWRPTDVQTENNPLLLPTVPRISPENASALSSNEAPQSPATEREGGSTVAS